MQSIFLHQDMTFPLFVEFDPSFVSPKCSVVHFISTNLPKHFLVISLYLPLIHITLPTCFHTRPPLLCEDQDFFLNERELTYLTSHHRSWNFVIAPIY
jgi:hypothetical protein